jgi:hypothetical protein
VRGHHSPPPVVRPDADEFEPGVFQTKLYLLQVKNPVRLDALLETEKDLRATFRAKYVLRFTTDLIISMF